MSKYGKSNDSSSDLEEENIEEITFPPEIKPGRFLSSPATRDYLFPGDSGPSLRSWDTWKREGYFSCIKIGRRVFCDPSVVRAELIEKFSIPARNDKAKASAAP